MSSSSDHTTPTISAFIVCCNEAQKIRRCLDSVRWCDEIVIVDSGSTDGTLEICSSYTSRIFHRDWTGYVEQKRFGLQQCTSDWVLNLDADEAVSVELREEIESVMQAPETERNSINGFWLSRVVFHLSRWWKKGGWYPEYRLRLLRRSTASWGGEEPHERAMVSGRTQRLKGDLYHFTYDDIFNQVAVANNFSSISSEGMFKAGKRVSAFGIIFRPISRFIKFYLFRRGYKEGFPGFIVAILESYSVFIKYTKLWEKQLRANKTD